MSHLPKIDADTLAQLQGFAAKIGRNWKQVLNNNYWYCGLPVPGFDKLYGLRNSHGPTWLYNFRFPKA